MVPLITFLWTSFLNIKHRLTNTKAPIIKIQSILIDQFSNIKDEASP